jgi:hypothetical protein
MGEQPCAKYIGPTAGLDECPLTVSVVNLAAIVQRG